MSYVASCATVAAENESTVAATAGNSPLPKVVCV